MYSFTHCKEPSCPRYATSLSAYCLLHEPSQDYISTLSEPAFDSVSLSNLVLRDSDLTQKMITGSLFSYSTFSGVTFDKTTMLNSNFSFCLFEKCTFDLSSIRYVILSGSTFIECTFLHSSITHTNLSGSVFTHSDFTGSNLYYSSFAHSYFNDTKIEDCDLRKSTFLNTVQTNLSFRWSNYKEAQQ